MLVVKVTSNLTFKNILFRLKDYEQINDNSKNDLNVHFFLLQELQPPNSPK